MKIKLRFLFTAAACAVALVRLAIAAQPPMASALLSTYVKVGDALAADDLVAAKAAASALADHADMAEQKVIGDQASSIAKAANLSTAREQFKALSNTIEPLAVGVDGYTVMTCAMARADWVQLAGDVKNPYLGKSMIGCGEPKQVDTTQPHDHDHASNAGHGCDDTPTDRGHEQHGCG